MKTFGLVLLNIVYLAYLIVISIGYELLSMIGIPLYVLSGKGKFDDAFRIHNWMYGRFVVKASWPYIRIRIRGVENIPARPPYVFVFNHRSYLDIFFSAIVPAANQLVIVRSWVFRLKLFGWAMRLARYLNIDKVTIAEFRQTGKVYSARKVSFQFYPEGHRSRDGKLRRFRAGAFLLANENNLPVIPVCMVGTNEFASYKFPYFRPARVEITVFPAVYPEMFDEELRPQKMRRYTEKLFRDFLGE